MIFAVQLESKPNQLVARIAIDSPLPNLDRLFDYSIPTELKHLANVGARVLVPFGRSKKHLEGFIVQLTDGSDFTGKLAGISEVVSPVPVLPDVSYKFLRAIADRQACALGDLLKLAVPSRSVAIEKKFVIQQAGYATNKQKASPKLTAAVIEPRNNIWVSRMLDFAKIQIETGFSCILLVPDFRDQAVLKKALSDAGIEYVDYSSDRKPSERYLSFLACLRPGTHVVVGSRNSIFAPLSNLGGIYLFDDSDDNLVEPTSPYTHVRDLVLLRQNLTNCDLAIESHYRSTEVQRLVEIGFLKDLADDFTPPKISVSDDMAKLPTMAWQAIKKAALDEGRAVLIQVSSRGIARSTYCFDCGERAMCHKCHGPIWIDNSNTPLCRWCSANNLNFKCSSCGCIKLRQGGGGATRTVAEIGKSFPGAQIIESTGDRPLLEIIAGKRIVVSTPGAEPRVEGGYACVVILDAANALARDSLRAQDIAIRNWTNAFALLSRDGRGVITGLPQELGRNFALWNLRQIASTELANRRELDFPPALRLASIQGEKSATAEAIAQLDRSEYQILGPISLRSDTTNIDSRYLIKYHFGQGAKLAVEIRAAIAKLSSGSTRLSKSGRTTRAIKVRMDDPEVI
ncbi:MAG: hypothetical protein RLZZ471_167 [Actinomycetota bacterium]|jgi:primosomal protein N' (replication factor Y)